MIFIPLVIAAAGLIATTFCKVRIATHCALFTVLALAVLIPSHSPPREVLSTAVVGAVVVLLVASLRCHVSLATAVPNTWLIAFVIYSSVVMIFESEGPYAWYVFLLGISYVLLSLLASQPKSNGTTALYVALPVFVAVQLALATSEEFLDTKALWPLTNGSDFITHRLNPVAPWLAGRAMGSTSHPIPLGILMGLSLVLCAWIAIHRRNRTSWIFVALAGVGILFSGTRSAILAAFISIVFWFGSSAGTKRLPVTILAGMFGIVVILTLDANSLPGLSGFYSSESYLHRSDVLDFLPELAKRSTSEIFFGSGYSSIASLLQSSIFAGGSGIQVFDQEYIRTFVATGIVGFVLLMLAIVEGFRRGNMPSRLILIFLCVTFASFDALSWNLSMTLFVLAASGPILQSNSEVPSLDDQKSLRLV